MVKKFDSNTFLSDVVSVEEMRAWKGNVIFDAGTGTGKTELILNNLSKACFEPFKKILILSSRDALTKEIRRKIENGLFNVDVVSYQYIESCINNGKTDSDIFQQEYGYIVLDECQHFTEGISDYTDLSFQWVIQHPAQKIFMSATAELLYKYLYKEGHITKDNYYQVPKSYDYVEDIYFFKRKSDIEYIVKDLMDNTNDKIIVFVNSIEECLKLYRTYEGDATFYCSPHIKDVEAKELLHKQPFKIKNESFETRLLIATCALDVGITLKNYEIKHIVASIFNHNQLAQCLGRKREIKPHDKQYINGKKDTCKYYIRSFNKREMNLLDKAQELYEMELFLLDNEQYIHRFGKDRKHNNFNINYKYDLNIWELNELGYINIKQHQNDLYEMRERVYKIGDKEFTGVGYKNFIIDKLKFPKEKVMDYEAVKQKQQEQSLDEYLDSIVGKKYYMKSKIEIIEMIGLRDKKGRLQKSIGQLNEYLNCHKFMYFIESGIDNRRTKEDVNGKKTQNENYKKSYWIVNKNEY